ILEYLTRLNNDGKGKVKASTEAAQLVFIESVLFRARTIQYWANYELQYDHLPISRQDDKDIAEKCHMWIQSQNGKTTLLKFKEFVEQKLLINLKVMKKKTISEATASHWLNVLRFFLITKTR
ncbi:13741_t:CDS:2, partial [Funneliformis geosporum]